MSAEEERIRGEKDEKEDIGEKWRRDPIDAIGWALFFIWAGLVLIADQLGYLVRFEGVEPWSIIIIGAGVIVLLQVLVRLVMPAYRKPVMGSIIFGFILLAVGLTEIMAFSWPVVGAFILIAVGVGIILGGLTRGRGP